MELTDILRQIDSLKKEAENLQPVKPELERMFWDKFRLEFNYNSNHMEGNTLTYGQTKLLLLFDRITGDTKGRDVEEMKAHNVALKMITELSADKESPLTEKLIREINELILVRPFYNDAITPDGKPTKRLISPGEYKKHPNSVLMKDGNMFYYASPEETPILMGDLIEWYNNEKDKIHPVELAAKFHYKLVRIHPFDDSNGRTTRLMMNYILMQNGYAPIVIESKKKEAYLTALNKADVGDIDAFVEYIAGLSNRWQEICLKAIKGEKIEEEDDFEKEIAVLKKNLKTKEDKLEILFSKDAVHDFFDISGYPLITKLISVLEKLDDFFFSREVSIQVTPIGSIWTNIHLSNIPLILSKIEEDIQTHLTVEFRYYHSRLKKGSENNYNYLTYLEITFYEFYYEVSSKNLSQLIIRKYYHQKLNPEEIESFSKSLANEELKEIKKIIDA